MVHLYKVLSTMLATVFENYIIILGKMKPREIKISRGLNAFSAERKI